MLLSGCNCSIHRRRAVPTEPCGSNVFEEFSFPLATGFLGFTDSEGSRRPPSRLHRDGLPPLRRRWTAPLPRRRLFGDGRDESSWMQHEVRARKDLVPLVASNRLADDNRDPQAEDVQPNTATVTGRSDAGEGGGDRDQPVLEAGVDRVGGAALVDQRPTRYQPSLAVPDQGQQPRQRRVSRASSATRSWLADVSRRSRSL